MPRKSKTAIGKVSEKVNKSVKKIREKSNEKISAFNKDTKRQEKTAANRARKIYQELGYNRKYIETKVLIAKQKVRERRAKGLQQLKSEKETKIFQVRQIGSETKDKIRDIARALAKSSGQKQSKTLKQSYTRILKSKPAGMKFNMPNTDDFKAVYIRGHVGRGLDYNLPISEKALEKMISKARAIKIDNKPSAFAYMIYLHVDTPMGKRTMALFDHSLHISYKIDFDSLIDKIETKISDMLLKYNLEEGQISILGLMIHFTIHGKGTS